MDNHTREQRADRPGVSSVDHRVIVTGVLSCDVVKVWKTVEPLIEKALGPGETTNQILTKLYCKEAQLWSAFEEGVPTAVVITEIVTRETGDKACNIWAASGTGLNNWFAHLAMIEAWAKENGCKYVTVERGRKGWSRLMKDYKVTHVTLEKEI